MSGRKHEAQCSLFETAAFGELRDRLDGIDLARAVSLGRGAQVTAYRAGDWVIRVPSTLSARACLSIELANACRTRTSLNGFELLKPT